MLIMSISQTSPGRLKVVLEDGSEIKSTLGAVTELRLYSGLDLEEEKLEQFRLLSTRFIARERALELISRRAMSRHELKKKLMDKGESEEVAEYCAGWLCENRFIDDESYAAAVARHYAAKGYGAGRVQNELYKRGIARELWDSAIEAMPINESKLERFISSRLSDPSDRDQVRKLSAALLRRGYSWDEIRAALERHQAEIEDF